MYVGELQFGIGREQGYHGVDERAAEDDAE